MQSDISTSLCVKQPSKAFFLPFFRSMKSKFRIRFDTNSLHSIDQSGEELVEFFLIMAGNREMKVFWTPKMALIIDNWRCTHARGGDSIKPEDRTLIRFEVFHDN